MSWFGFGKNKNAEPQVRCGLSCDEAKDVIESAGLNIEEYKKGIFDEITISGSNIKAVCNYNSFSKYIFTKDYADWLAGHPEIFNTKKTEDIQTQLGIEPAYWSFTEEFFGKNYRGFQKHDNLSVKSSLAKERFRESIDKVLVFTEYIDESLEKILAPTQKIQEAIVNKPDSEAMKRMREYLAEPNIL